MLNKLSTYLLFGNQFCGIEHSYINNTEKITAILLKKKKQELEMSLTFETESIKEIAKKISKKQHAFLVINNSNVIIKTVQSDQQDAIKLINNAFPNIDLDVFYYDILSQKDGHFISIARKEYIDTILKGYQSHDISIVGLSLGNNSLSIILDFIKNESVYTSNSNITLEDYQIKAIHKTEELVTENYSINGLEVNNKQILPFSGAISYITNQNTSKTNFKAEEQLLLNNFKHSQFYSQFLKFGLITILGLLLINFFMFNYYFEHVNTLQATSQINQSTKAKVTNLNEYVSKTENMVNDMLEGNASKSSFYINTIINSLPNSILLSELNYQPLEKRIKKDEPITIKFSIITIAGSSSDSDAFSNWLSVLEHEHWCSKIDILEYGSSSKSSPNFKINIALKDD